MSQEKNKNIDPAFTKKLTLSVNEASGVIGKSPAAVRILIRNGKLKGTYRKEGIEHLIIYRGRFHSYCTTIGNCDDYIEKYGKGVC